MNFTDKNKFYDYLENDDLTLYVGFISCERGGLNRSGEYNEMDFITDGSAVYDFGDESGNVNRGDIIFAGTGERRCFRNANGLQMYAVLFKNDIFTLSNSIESENEYLKIFMNSCREKRVFELATDDFMKIHILLDEMYAEYKGDDIFRKTALISYFSIIAVIISRLDGKTCGYEQRNTVNVSDTASFIENHFAEKFSLDELAAMSHYSPRQFTRIFISIYGTTPQKYILSLRLKKACTLLKETDISVEDTALRCGFGDGNYFSRMFRKYIGMTPKQYRSIDK